MFYIALFVNRVICMLMPESVTIFGSSFMVAYFALGYFFEARAKKRTDLMNNKNLLETTNSFHPTPILDAGEALQIASRTSLGGLPAPFGPAMYLHAFHPDFQALENSYALPFKIIYAGFFILVLPIAFVQGRETYIIVRAKIQAENERLQKRYAPKTESSPDNPFRARLA